LPGLELQNIKMSIDESGMIMFVLPKSIGLTNRDIDYLEDMRL